MKILDKTIVSNQQPVQTNVLWLDTNSNELKIFKNGSWQNLTSPIPEWALQPNPPSLNDLNAVGEEYTKTLIGTTNAINLDDCEFPTNANSLSDLSNEQIEFVRYIVDKVINNNVEELKLKSIFLADETYYCPITVACSTQSQGSGVMIFMTGYQGSQFYPDLGPDYITTLSIRAQLNNQELIDAGVVVRRVPARAAKEDVNTNIKTIKPNVFYRWFSPQTSLNITLEPHENDNIVNEYMFEFQSGATPTTLSLPSSVKWVETPTIEANKTYQVSIVNDIAIIVGV